MAKRITESVNTEVAAPEVAVTPEVEAVEPSTEETIIVPIVELPEYVKRNFQIFSNYKELYITPVGGAYAVDPQPYGVEGAILYQNPYINN